MNTAYELGWLAGERGASLSACPYISGSGAAIAWRSGWRDAQAAAYPTTCQRHGTAGHCWKCEEDAAVHDYIAHRRRQR